MSDIKIPNKKKTIRISEAELLLLKNRSRAGRKRKPVAEAVDLPGEEWGRIPEADDYFYSTFGRVKKDIELASGVRRCFLIAASLYNNTYSVLINLNNNMRVRVNIARLVLMAFDPRPDQQSLFPVNLDGDRSNNRLDNLKWMTRKERKEYSFTTRERKPALKLKQYYNKRGTLKTRKVVFDEKDLARIKELYALGYTQQYIAKEVGTTQQYISEVIRNRVNHVQ